MEDKKEPRWGWDEAGEPCMWYCEKCDGAWWYDETNQIHGSGIPPMYKEAVIRDVEHKICPSCGGVLDKQALKRAIDATILKAKEIHKKMHDGAVYDYHGNPKGIPTVILKEPRYDTCGWAWMVFETPKNKQLFDLFEAYGSKVPDDEIDMDNKRVFYHLTKSDVPPAENLDDDASEDMISRGISETSAMRDWKQQHFEVRFDFEDDDSNDFYDQSQLFKEEVYEFLLTQLKPFGLDAEIKHLTD